MMATIDFADGLDSSAFSDHSREVLTYLLDTSGNPSCTITCLGRSPHDQARVMRANCLRNGVALQYKTYSQHDAQGNVIRQLPGCRVVDVFVASAHLDGEATIAAMEAKIIELSPEHVSKHCGDQAILQVMDIAHSSMHDVTAFEKIANAHVGADVGQCLDENGCSHVTIPQP